MNRPKQAAGGRRQAARTLVDPPGWRHRPWRPETKSPPVGPRGFTLVELLVVIVIIGILASMAMAALSAARQKARVAKTRATIVKLDTVLMERYESYATRRLPLSQGAIYSIAVNRVWIVPPAPLPRTVALRVQLSARYDLMRLEMPDRWSDVVPDPNNPTSPGPFFLRDEQGNVLRPALSQRYMRAYNNSTNATFAWGGAECLYQIIRSIPDGLENFRENEIGDIDGDGLREFHDAWGRPIQFLRWPCGFVDYQNLVAHNRGTDPAGRSGGPTFDWGSPSDRQSGNPLDQPDPFDSMAVMNGVIELTPLTVDRQGYYVYPLIYSAGPDGKYDINEGTGAVGGSTFAYQPTLEGDINAFVPDDNPNPDASGNTRRYVGQPYDTDVAAPLLQEGPNDSLDHYDNIHNHRIEATR